MKTSRFRDGLFWTLVAACAACDGSTQAPLPTPSPSPAPPASRVVWERVVQVTTGGRPRVRDIAVDAEGSVYLTGDTTSSDYPTTDGAYDRTCGTDGRCNADPGRFISPRSDVFVTKLDAQGKMVYSTFIGTDSVDEGHAIAVDAAGRAWISGESWSADFPVSAGAQRCGTAPDFSSGRDAFVLRLSADGSAVDLAACFGGDGVDIGEDIALGPDNSVYVAGFTASVNFPLVRPLQPVKGDRSDLFVMRLGPDSVSPLWATYLGGSGLDVVNGLGVDGAGSVVVAGYTDGADWPRVRSTQAAFGGVVDAFVTKIDREGALLVFSTTIGGAGIDRAEGAAVAADGRAWIVGFTNSGDFPVSDGVADAICGTDGTCNAPESDGFAVALGPLGEFEWGTFLGGGNADLASRVAIDPTGRLVVLGETQSTDYPLVDPEATSWPPEPLRGVPFLSDLTAAAALVWSTLVPVAAERPMAPYAVTVSVDRSRYVAGSVSRGLFVVKIAGQ